jgi:hypothetical protein
VWADEMVSNNSGPDTFWRNAADAALPNIMFVLRCSGVHVMHVEDTVASESCFDRE